MIKVGMIGFGGIAQAHRAAYNTLVSSGVPVRLVAVCDINPDRFKSKVEINIAVEDTGGELQFTCYTSLDEMLKKEELDLIDICLPTPFHADMTVKMLNAGYHVLCEKPMSLDFDKCLKMLDAAKNAKGKLMIGQCLRFYPQYEYLKSIIENETYGKPLTAFFHRLSTPPTWGWENWYMDYERSGGCITDLHIHDIDMIRYLFGEPEAVSCMSQDSVSKFATVYTRLVYDNLPVFALGDWSVQNIPFSHGYRVGFEKTTVVFENGRVMVYPQNEEPFDANIQPVDGIQKEIEYFVGLLESGKENIKNPPQSAALSVKLVDTMKKSAMQNGNVIPFEAVSFGG